MNNGNKHPNRSLIFKFNIAHLECGYMFINIVSAFIKYTATSQYCNFLVPRKFQLLALRGVLG